MLGEDIQFRGDHNGIIPKIKDTQLLYFSFIIKRTVGGVERGLWGSVLKILLSRFLFCENPKEIPGCHLGSRRVSTQSTEYVPLLLVDMVVSVRMASICSYA